MASVWATCPNSNNWDVLYLFNMCGTCPLVGIWCVHILQFFIWSCLADTTHWSGLNLCLSIWKPISNWKVYTLLITWQSFVQHVIYMFWVYSMLPQRQTPSSVWLAHLPFVSQWNHYPMWLGLMAVGRKTCCHRQWMVSVVSCMTCKKCEVKIKESCTLSL